MKLTPLDIRKHEFNRRFRGYDPDEVRPFLEMLSQQWDELNEELRHAQERVRETEIKIAHYEKVEEALQEALQSARLNAKRTQDNAEDRSRLMVEEAELRAEQIVREAEQERNRLRQDVSQLSHRHSEVTARLRHFLMSELEILAQHEEERPIGFMKLIPAREAEALPAPPDEPRAEAPKTDVPDTSPAQPEPEQRRTQQAEASGTTYADIYARAAHRDEDEHQHESDLPDDQLDELEEEPAWTLRSIVADDYDDDDQSATDERSPERDTIRRIIEDLD